MRARIVPEFDHARVPLERGLNDSALDAAAAAVHQPHFAESCGSRGLDVFSDHGRDIRRRERVQIDFSLDWNLDRLVGHTSP